MSIEDVKSSVRSGDFRLSLHAEIEATNENLEIAQIVRAILNGSDNCLYSWSSEICGPVDKE